MRTFYKLFEIAVVLPSL